jgi:hypothetical protein
VVLYECETWSLTLKAEHRLRVFENRVLRRIFGLKRDEVTEGCRKLHYEELHNLYTSPSIIRKLESVHSSEMLVNFYQISMCDILNDNTVHSLPCEHQISHKLRLIFKASFLSFFLKGGKETVNEERPRTFYLISALFVVFVLSWHFLCCFSTCTVALQARVRGDGQVPWNVNKPILCNTVSSHKNGKKITYFSLYIYEVGRFSSILPLCTVYWDKSHISPEFWSNSHTYKAILYWRRKLCVHPQCIPEMSREYDKKNIFSQNEVIKESISDEITRSLCLTYLICSTSVIWFFKRTL